MKNKVILSIMSFICVNLLFSQNLLTNGNFESGGVGVGFNTNGTGYVQIFPPFVGTTVAGNFALTTNPQPMNTTFFIAGGDHTSGTGNMLVIDGNATGGQQRFWEAGNAGAGVNGLTVGTTYTFSYWIKSVSTTVIDNATRADIGIQIDNANSVTLLAGTAMAPLPAAGWQRVSYTFVPTNSSVYIKLFNNNTNLTGNDFAVDDFTLSGPLSITSSVINTNCIGTNNGSITVYASGGALPYGNYTLSGSASQTNTTGVFTGLAPGTYTVSVIDANGATVNQSGITISNPTNPLVVTPNTSICAGNPVTLSASGGDSYTWTASPTDVSLIAPNSPTPTVSPLVNTIYTVTAPVTSSKNLVFNGNFTQGNIGFGTDYQYLAASPVGGVQKAYGITTAPNTWFSPFSTCGDHTTGTGNMMVIDGSNVNAGNDRVWFQTIPVSAGQNYTFSYWVQTVATPNPAQLEVVINGVSIGTATAPTVATCGNWTQYTYTWASGAVTTAQITIYDRNVIVSGNDFAIDDITFTTSVTCTYTKTVTITVNQRPNVVVNSGVLCQGNPIPIHILAQVTPAAGTYSYQWTVPVGFTNPGNVSQFNTTIAGTYTVIVTNTTTGCQSFASSGVVTTDLPSATCAAATQGCPGSGFTYCNTTGVPSTGNPGCLGSNPNPAWFYMQVGTSGNIDILIQQSSNGTTPNLDVDFICYGPFTQPTCTGLGAANQVDCSYSIAPTETCNIPNAVVGQFYMICITNFSNQSGTISFSQSNSGAAGAGSITCDSQCALSIIGDAPICSGTSTTLSASLTGLSYTWTSTAPGFVNPGSVPNINVTQPGTYTLNVVRPGCIITPASFTLTQFPIPNTGIPTDLTVCDGATFNLTQNDAVVFNGLPDLSIYYYASLQDFNNGIPIINVTTYTGVEGQVIYVRVEDGATFCTYSITPFVLHFQNCFTCQTITNPSSSQTICLNADPSAFSVNTSSTTANSISYVYFNTQQTGNAMYTGGTLLANTTPVTGVATYNAGVLGTAGSLPNTAGTYYIYAILNPAPVDATCRPYQEIIVTVNNSVNAGTDGNTTICETSTTAINLFNLITGEQSGGTWTQTGGSGGTFNAAAGTFTPAVGATTSTFEYTLTGVAPCVNDVSIATININAQPNAGTDGNTTVCETSTTVINLFDLITGEQSGGTWTQTGGSGGTFNAAVGTFTPAVGATTSTFEYTLTGVAPCVNDVSIATININAQPNAGTDGNTTVCETSTTVINLFDLITGEQSGGTWTQTGGSGGTFNAAVGTFTPAVGATTSTFEYTATGVAPCVNDVSIATININAQPNAGTDGNTTVCETSTTAINLFNLITGEQSGGTWTQTGGSGGTFNAVAGTYTPAVGATTSTFEYTLTGVAPCINDVSIATININAQPNAGTDGSISACETSTATINLFNLIIGEQSGGTWTQTGGSGGTFNATAGTFTPAVGATTSTFEYLVTGVAPCLSDTSIATVTINTPPVLTTPPAYAVCDDNNDGHATFDLHSIDSTITGGNATLVVTYHVTQADGVSGAAPITTFPYANNDPNSQTVYAHVVDPATPNCSSSVALQLIVNPKPVVSVNSPSVCAGATATVTATMSTAGSYSYAWTVPAGATNPGDVASFTTTIAGDYCVVVTNTATTCVSNSICGTVTVNPLPTPVNPNPMTMCSNGATNQAIFNLPLNDSVVTNGVAGYTITYHHFLADAQGDTAAINPANAYLGTHGETVYIRMENATTGCYATTTLLLQVTQGPVAVTPSPLELCDDNNDGFGIFNLSDATNEISGGSLPPDVSITYHLTQSDAQTGANALPTTGYPNNDPWTQTIYVRVYYTLTGCANYVQLQLIVHPKPVATTPSDYHVCDDNADGTAVFDLSTVIPQVLGTISAATHTVTFHTTEQNAIDDINPINGVTNYSSASTTIWIRVETNATGCYDVVPLNLVVDSLPIANVPYIYRKCDYNSPLGYEIFNLTSQIPTILNGQTGMQVVFYPSLANAQSGTNAINTPSAYQNAVVYVQTVGIRIVNSATGCYVVSSLDLYVDQLPTPTPPAAPLTICDSDQNGWNSFNLCSLDSEIQNGQTPAYILTYHVTLADAQNDVNAIGCTYQNNFALSQTIYVRAEDAQTGCYSTLPIQLNVNASPIMPSLSNLQLCDTDSATQDGCTTFNLSSQTPTVLAANTPSSNYTVTYYTTQANAEAIPNGNLPIVNTSSYFACNGTTIWVRVQNNTTGCFEVGSFQLIVNTPIVLAAPTLYKECDNDSAPNDLHTSFDILNFVSSSVPSGYTIAFYSNAAHTLPISSPYTNTVNANQTIYWTATNNTTGCVSSATLTLVVIPVPTPKYNPAPLASCDTVGPNDGCEVFNLTTNAAYIMNNEPNVELHYYPSQADADTLTNEIMTPAAANVCGDVYIRVQWVPTFGFTDYTNQPCYVVVRQPIFIDPLPLMQAGQTYQECDDDTDGFTPFNLVQYVTNTAATPPFLIVNPNINIASVTFTYYTDAAMTQAIATPSAFTNTSNPQTVYIMASHTTSHTVNGVTISTTCTATQSLSLVVNPKPTLTVPAAGILDTCDTDGTNDGYFVRDLTLLNSDILGAAQLPADYTVNYYESEYNPDAIPPLTPAAITNPTAYATHTQTLWVSVTNNVTGCYRAAPIAIVVEQLPEPYITYNFDVLCVDFANGQVLREVVLTAHNDVVYLGAPTIAPPTYTYQWYNSAGAITGATQSTYTINQALTNNTADTYHVVMTSSSSLGCSTASANQPIIQSGPATPSDAAQVGYTVTNAFAENQIITVTVEGYGVYEYSLDDGPRQTSTVFENVGIGSHTIYVWDTEGGLSSSCDPLVITNVQTIDYPHYFTPNGDGYHDTWNIQGLYNQPNAKIYIFDRYGKLIKQLSSQSLGWDGTYNGYVLPASDYWFTVDFIENNSERQFKAHFSLKR